MGFYQNRVLPHIIEFAMQTEAINDERKRCVEHVKGAVLEIGFGSGLNVAHYPRGVHRVQAVDPAALGRKLAARRLADSPVPVEFVGTDGQQLPVDTDSVDHVLATWTLCTIPEPDRALAEIHRVLRTGGQFHFVDHGRSPEPRVARWQDRLTPIQRRVAGGCHLGRPVRDLIEAAGFEISTMANYYVSGPKPFGYTYEGVAIKG